jgi:3-phenylpropionate/trans-cinnamate dioxygenase ferredoxin reductase subunit
MEEAELTVADVRSVGADAVAIDFESPSDFEAMPGQFVKLTLAVDGEDASRFYTISSPDVDDTFEITVGIDPDGDVGPLLADLSAGDAVWVSGPFGSSYYEGEPQVLVVAGGPGVGPAVGIGERALDDGGHAAVVYQDEAPIHEDRLSGLADRGASIAVLGPNEDVGAAVGDALTEDTQVFVYGFADFLDTATAAISAAGGEPDEAKVENFG